MDEIGEGDHEVQTASFKINKSQGFKVQHRAYSQLYCNNFVWHIMYENTESLFCTPETNIKL